MRFESVKAYSFGPFRNQTLEPAPGMNVVFGPNVECGAHAEGC